MSADAERFPVGRFEPPPAPSAAQVQEWIATIAVLPDQVRAFTEALDGAQLDTPYRPGSWTVRQVVHHIADSHCNSYIRIKWALTENEPVIKAYDEVAWAQLPDSTSSPVALSLDLLDALHRRWVALLSALDGQQLQRVLVHPESGPWRVDQTIGSYAWHGRHHLAVVERLAQRQGWSKGATR